MSHGSALKIDLARCCACRACEVACSFHLTGAFNPEAAAIRVSYDAHTGDVRVDLTAACDRCQAEEGGPLCAAYCPLKIIEAAA